MMTRVVESKALVIFREFVMPSIVIGVIPFTVWLINDLHTKDLTDTRQDGDISGLQVKITNSEKNLEQVAKNIEEDVGDLKRGMEKLLDLLVENMKKPGN